MMKKLIFILLSVPLLYCACSKDSPRYPDGYDKIYYSFFDYEYDDFGNPTLTSSTINLDKTEEGLTEMGVKFMSNIERDFDVEVRLYLRTSKWFLEKLRVIRHPGMFSTPDSLAVPGLDFVLLDEEMNAISPVRGDSLTYYSLVFPKAKKETRKLYIKSLNNQDYACPRYAWFSLALTYPSYEDEESLKANTVNHKEKNYQVNTITKSWLRTLIIK